MAKIQMSCPRCRQPITADVEQLFDVGADPDAKQKFLSGSFNIAKCPACGYQGPLSTPVVYHDPERELLLTYFPPELGLPVNDQERMIGPLITKVVNNLPAEKRKGYLFRPQTMFTQQLMIEKVLEGEGITREMMEASQQRLNLLQRLMGASSPDVRAEIIQQEQKLVDEQFFEIIHRLAEASMAQGDQNSARALAALQQEIMPLTEVGRKLQDQSQDMQAAVQALQEASQKGLTRDSLLDLIIAAPSEIYLATLVNMARSGLDYEFFSILSGRIEQAEGEEKDKLTQLREHLTQMSQEIDQRMTEQLETRRALVNEILQAEDVQKAAAEAMPDMDDYFAEALRAEIDQAQKDGDTERLGKLQQIVGVIQQVSTPPAEIALAEELLGAGDDAARQAIFEAHREEITPEFLQMINGLVSQLGEQGQAEVSQQLQEIYRAALRFSMQANLKG